MGSLISKKELLSSTGISYGQLYRWKREGLIPEEWFNKQSSFTGQETFFPREEILSRIASILAMKDTHSLEELSSILGANDDRPVTPEALRSFGPAGEAAAAILSAAGADTAGTESGEDSAGRFAGTFRLGAAAFAYGICELAESGKLESHEARSLATRCLPELRESKVSALTCSVFRSGEGLYACFSKGPEGVAFDSSIEVVARLPLGEITNSITARLQGDTACKI